MQASAKDAIAERDEARHAWDRLRAEVATLKAQPASRPAPPVVISDSAIAEENDLAERRAALVAEQQAIQAEAARLKELGQQFTYAAIKPKLADIQRELAAVSTRLKPLKGARNNEITRLKRERRRLEPYKPAGEAAKASEALT